MHDTAPSFAEAMTRWSAAPGPATSRANAALYDRLLSNERYFADLSALIEGKLSLVADTSPADYSLE